MLVKNVSVTLRAMHHNHISYFSLSIGHYILADLTVSKRPGTSYQIEIRFAVVNHLYLLFSFVKVFET